MPSNRILICGAGVAGSTLAYWLAKHDFQVVVVERSSAEQTAGQGIDIEGPGLEIVKLMGILDKIKEKTTGELGIAIVDEQSRSCGIFEADGLSLTKSIEIMRGDLTEILYNAANESANVTFQFETTIQSLRQTQDKVLVDLENKNNKTVKAEEFDFVVGADGVRSRTRQLAMGSPLNCLKSVGCFCAFFSIPKEEQDWPYSRLCQFTDRRSICIRPRGKETEMSSVYLGHFPSDPSDVDYPSLRQARDAGDKQMQKEAIAKLYTDLGWETPRVIEQMMRAENFYFDEIMQVKLPKWSQNRVVLLGDAAYAPSPLTGQGTILAILGAYVLAQELSRNRDDESAAFEKYEKRLRSYVGNAQNIALGGYAPYILNPQTSWGIWLFRMIAGFIAWTKLSKILPAPKGADFDLEIEGVKA